ncbi:MAG: CFI-box-CTERM domain-containing protein [Candidatus Nitrosotenuis sp.]
MISSTGSFAFGQSSQIPPLSVKTELPLYESGDRVVFNGLIKSPDANNLIDITVRIVGPIVNGTGATNIVTVKQVRPLLDGTFVDNFVVGGPLWTKKGDYKIIVNYGPQKAETTFFYNGGNDVPTPIIPNKCLEGQVLDGAGNCINPPEKQIPICGEGTVYDSTSQSCIVKKSNEPEPTEPEPTEPKEINCGSGTHAENGICVPDKQAGKSGCLIATAAFGTELAPQVQLLREVRDGILYNTGAGTTFMTGFNEFYYAFSPAVADMERQSPLFKDVIKTSITPMLYTLSILNHVEINSEQEMFGYGIGLILLNVGMYFVVPALVIVKVKGFLNKRYL